MNTKPQPAGWVVLRGDLTEPCIGPFAAYVEALAWQEQGNAEEGDCCDWSVWPLFTPPGQPIAASPALLHAAEEAMREATNDIAGIDRDEALAILSSIAGILGPAIKQAKGA